MMRTLMNSLLASLSPAVSAPGDVDLAEIDRLLGSDDPADRGRGEALAAGAGAAAVQPLLEAHAQATPTAMRVAEGALYAVAARASAPGDDAERTAVARELARAVEGELPGRTRDIAARVLSLVADGSSGVSELAWAARQVPELRDAALFSLERIEGHQATDMLFELVKSLPDESKAAAVHALGARADERSLGLLLLIAGYYVPDIGLAAIEELARSGSPEAVETVAEAVRTAQGDDAKALVHAGLALADGIEEHEPMLARRLYRLCRNQAATDAQRSAAEAALARLEE